MDWLDRLLVPLAAVWNYVLASPDGRAITIGNLATGLLLVVLGFVLSKWISRAFANRLLQRFGMTPANVGLLQSVAFYVLLVTFSLFSLHIANIPLAVFTVLGGAIAIGVGFGSQSVVNNFISGLVLLAERPIRVGDTIQIDDLYGKVESIGTRSTRLRTATNLDITVPNSSLLQNNVVNWTLSNNLIRTHVCVGVAYGSPTREVTKLLRHAVDDHGQVLRKPAPFVLFTEFGDNALQFEVHFWVRMESITVRYKIESDVRHRICSLLAEAGIVIAFPQRDVHLDTLRPMDVRLVPADAPEVSAGEDPPVSSPAR